MAITRLEAIPTAAQRLGSVAYKSAFVTSKNGNRFEGNAAQSPFVASEARVWAAFGRVYVPTTVASSALWRMVKNGAPLSHLILNAIPGSRSGFTSNSLTLRHSNAGSAVFQIEAGISYTASLHFSQWCNWVVCCVPGTTPSTQRKFYLGALDGQGVTQFGSASADTTVTDYHDLCDLSTGTGFRMFGDADEATPSSADTGVGEFQATHFVVPGVGRTLADLNLDPVANADNWAKVQKNPEAIWEFVTEDDDVFSYGDLHTPAGDRVDIKRGTTLADGYTLRTPDGSRSLTLKTADNGSSVVNPPTAFPDYSPMHSRAGSAFANGYDGQVVPREDVALIGMYWRRTSYTGSPGVGPCQGMGVADKTTGKLVKPVLIGSARAAFTDSSDSNARGEQLGWGFRVVDNHEGVVLGVSGDAVIGAPCGHTGFSSNTPASGDEIMEWNGQLVFDDTGSSSILRDIRTAAFGEDFGASVDAAPRQYRENMTAYHSICQGPGGCVLTDVRMASAAPTLGRFGVQKTIADDPDPANWTIQNCVLTKVSNDSPASVIDSDVIGHGYAQRGGLMLPNGHYLGRPWVTRVDGNKMSTYVFCAIIDANADISNGSNVFASRTGEPCDGAGDNPTLGSINTSDERFNLYWPNDGLSVANMDGVRSANWVGCNRAGTLVALAVAIDGVNPPTTTVEAGSTTGYHILVFAYSAANKRLTPVRFSDNLLATLEFSSATNGLIQMVSDTGAVRLGGDLDGTTKVDGTHQADSQGHPMGDIVEAFYCANIFTAPGAWTKLPDAVYDCGNTGSGTSGLGGLGCHVLPYGNAGEIARTAAIEVCMGVVNNTAHGHVQLVSLDSMLAPYETQGGGRLDRVERLGRLDRPGPWR